MVLQSSILQIAEMSETARDNLIKKHMVCLFLSNTILVVEF